MIKSSEIVIFQEACLALASWPEGNELPGHQELQVWQWIADNHRYNSRLWAEEDLARRKDVPDSEIAKNKRAIDGFNQARNDATERVDEEILVAMGNIRREPNARQHSETAGMMIDRMSIMALKIKAMRAQTERQDASDAHRESCQSKLKLLLEQRGDLATCLDRLLTEMATGQTYFKIYRQFKMYNDPTLNPCLYGSTS